MKSVHFFILTLLAGCFISCNVASQEQTTQDRLTVQQLKEDLQIMRSRLEGLHPGLYEYTPKKQMNAYFDSLFAAIKQPMSELEFLRFIKPFLIKIKDGHTNIYPSERAVEASQKQHKFIPFGVRCLGKRVFLVEQFTKQLKISPGSEILAINRQPIKDILDAFLYKYSTRDGYNETFPRYLINRVFGSAYYWYIGQSDKFEIKYKTPEGQVNTTTVAAANPQDITQYFAKNPRKNQDEMLEFKVLNGNTAYLRVSSFSTSQISSKGQSFHAFVDKSFQTIAQRKLKYLILDMRGNGGGNDALGAEIFKYLTDKPFGFYKSIQTITQRIENTQYFDGGLSYFNSSVSRRLRSLTNGRYLVKSWPGLRRFKPKRKNRFKGKMYVLLDGGSFSSTTEFASIIHYHKRATFVGEESGGNYHTNTSGIMPVLVLPHSKIRVRMGLLQYRTVVGDYPKGKGILPDYPVNYTIQDVLQKRDVVLNRTLDLIKQASQK